MQYQPPFGTIAMIFGLGCALALLLSILTHKRYGHSHAVVISIMLCGSWAFSKAMTWQFDLLTARALHPITDLTILTMAMLFYWSKQEIWKLAIGFAIMTKLVLNVWFWADGGGPYRYVLCRNILFGMEILFVSWPGTRIVGGSFVGDLFGRRRDRFGDGFGFDRRPRAAEISRDRA